MKTPFQYFLHIEYENENKEHKYLLLEVFCNPRLELI